MVRPLAIAVIIGLLIFVVIVHVICGKDEYEQEDDFWND